MDNTRCCSNVISSNHVLPFTPPCTTNPLVYTFFMPKTELNYICKICHWEFDKSVGLIIHKRTCKTKAAEKEKDAQYERELAEKEKEKKGMSLILSCLHLTDFNIRCCSSCRDTTTSSASMGESKISGENSSQNSRSKHCQWYVIHICIYVNLSNCCDHK